MVKTQIPKDILIFNWFWSDTAKGEGEANDKQLQKWGFQQVYGNFEPVIKNFARRNELKGMLGGASSSWAATTEYNFGKDLLYDFLGCANLLWSTNWPEERVLARNIQSARMLIGILYLAIRTKDFRKSAIIMIDFS